MRTLGFAVEVDGRLLDHRAFVAAGEVVRGEQDDGARFERRCFRHRGIEVRQTVRSFPGLELLGSSIEVHNASGRELTITRLDSISLALPADAYKLLYFRSDWGAEFSPTEVPLAGTKILEVTTGRSSKGMHPWFFLKGSGGGAISGAVAWSGNWIIRFEPEGASHRLSGGLSNWLFAKTLKPGESMRSPEMFLVDLPQGDLGDTSLQFARWGRKYGYPRNKLSRSMPAEWNHWWPYEDAAINERVFKANSDVGKAMGTEAAMLDAGWFGPPDGKGSWYEQRGDWHLVNRTRFPGGIKSLGEHVKANGQAFGVWCEIEAIGKDAELARLHPEFLARRDGRGMGYVCFGNPQVREWAFGVVERLISEFGAQWIKFDFNLDPGEGCNRTDHGHGAGDGLYEHYMGYYSFLDRIRGKYPEVLLENCSSGGLRIDLGMMQHAHATFLSDPDYADNCLQLTWGAATMLHPSAILHFTWSHTREGQQHNRRTDPIPADAPRHRVDYIMRAGMLGILGMSYRLTDLPPAHRERMVHHVRFYKEKVRELVRDGDFCALTPQPNRDGTGTRWPAFLSVTESRERGILFVFHMTGGETSAQVKLKGLDPAATYELHFQDSGQSLTRTGGQLMNEGLLFTDMPEESSEIVFITRR